VRIHVLVEGQTEKIVFDELIAAELEAVGHYPSSSIVATKKPAAGGKFRGGVTSWRQLQSEILKLVPGFDLVSTMIDYYGFPADAPGMSDRPSGPASLRVSHVEQRIADSVDSARFRPFLVMHEIEAWVLAAAAHLGRCGGDDPAAEQVRKWCEQCGGPEEVDDGVHRSPSKRLARVWPDYAKTVDGPHSSCGRLARRPSAPHALGWTRGCGACSPSRAVDAESGFVGSESFSLDTHSPAGRGAVTATTIADPNQQHEQVRRRAPGGVQIAFSHGSPSRSPFPVRTSCRAWPSFLRRG